MPNNEPKAKQFKPLFSQRQAIAEEAVKYLESQGADIYDQTNIVGALSALGYLKDKE